MSVINNIKMNEIQLLSKKQPDQFIDVKATQQVGHCEMVFYQLYNLSLL